MNVLTIFNARLLFSYFTKNQWLVWFGTILYQSNNFHFIDLYARPAIGEAFAYAWLPLVLLGLLQIHIKEKNNGVLILGLSMGMIANSHILYLLIAAIFIIVFKVVEVIKKNFSLLILKRLVVAAFVAFLVALYSLHNIFIIYSHSIIVEPGKILLAVNPVDFWNSSLINDLTVRNVSWSYGLPLFIIQITLSILLIKKNISLSEKWMGWVLGADIITIVMMNWFPWSNLEDSFLSLIQFLSRLELLIVIFIAISAVLYFKNQSHFSKRVLTLIMFATILFSYVGTDAMHSNYASRDEKLTSSNYEKKVQNGTSIKDYFPVSKSNHKKTQLLEKKTDEYKQVDSDTRSATYETTLSKSKIIKFPALMYDGFYYEITIDGKQVDSLDDNQLKLRVPAGIHTVKIKSINSRQYLWFGISLITFILVNLKLITQIIKARTNDKNKI